MSVAKDPSLELSRSGKPLPFLVALLKNKCNHCRQGDLFKTKSSYTKGFMQMNESCPVCGHPTELETGFYYGTGYVSYALTVALSVSTFVAWFVLIGMSVHDNRVFYWLILNAVLLIGMQPYLMRLSRTIWYSFFVKYDRYWRERETEEATPEA